MLGLNYHHHITGTQMHKTMTKENQANDTRKRYSKFGSIRQEKFCRKGVIKIIILTKLLKNTS